MSSFTAGGWVVPPGRARPCSLAVAAPVPLDKALELGKHGTNRYTSRVDDINSRIETKGGTDKAYLARRIQRDAPEIAAKLAEYPSVHAVLEAIPHSQPRGAATLSERLQRWALLAAVGAS